MRDELKYPRVFALMEVEDDLMDFTYTNRYILVQYYLVSPCYLVSKDIHYEYSEDGNEKINETFDVVFPKLDVSKGLYHPKFYKNFDASPQNKGYVSTVDYITYDYDEAIKKRDELNNRYVVQHIYGDVRSMEKEEIHNGYIKAIIRNQNELNKLEPKEQVKKKIKSL